MEKKIIILKKKNKIGKNYHIVFSFVCSLFYSVEKDEINSFAKYNLIKKIIFYFFIFFYFFRSK